MSLCVIDHIVLLLSSPEFDNLPTWLSDNFTVIPGGRHTGQPSQNKLIVFNDGTYLELFNWYDTPPAPTDQKLPMRVWAQKDPGLIDFALSSLPPSTAEEYVDALNDRLAAGEDGLGVAYHEPIPGGRKTNDGVDIKWKVTRPVFSNGSKTPEETFFPGGRLDSPFFCHDVTDRQLRVPSNDPSRTSHPCEAQGICKVEVMVPKDKLSAYTELYSKVTDCSPVAASSGTEGVMFSVGVPDVESRRCDLVIRTPRSELESKRMQERGIGIACIELLTDKPQPTESVPLGKDEIGSTIRKY